MTSFLYARVPETNPAGHPAGPRPPLLALDVAPVGGPAPCWQDL
jgi:hypothetical protein